MKMARRVLVCGGRDYNNKKLVYKVLDASHTTKGISCIIHGKARGADRLAAQWAKDRRIKEDPYPADWDGLGRRAGPVRNQQMLDEGRPDVVYAFPGGVGTADMVRRANKAGVTVVKIHDAKR